MDCLPYTTAKPWNRLEWLDNGKVLHRQARPQARQRVVRPYLFEQRHHILTAPYSPTTTGKIERLHKTMRKGFFSLNSLDSIERAQAAVDAWVSHYSPDREHQAIGDVTPITRFELAAKRPLKSSMVTPHTNKILFRNQTSPVGGSTKPAASASSSTGTASASSSTGTTSAAIARAKP